MNKKIKKQFIYFKGYFEKFLPEDKSIRIVDLGCGMGILVLWLKNLGYQNVLGVDFDKEKIKKGKEFGVNDIFQKEIKEFLKEATFKREKYQLVFLKDVLEHFNKAEVIEVLKDIYQILDKNGKLIIQTINAKSPFFGRIRYGDFTHQLAFTEESIKEVLEKIGFSKIEIYPQRPVVYGVKSLVRYLVWRFIELEIKFYLLAETGTSKGIFTQNMIVAARKWKSLIEIRN